MDLDTKVSSNFTVGEFVCSHCNLWPDNGMDPLLIEGLQEMRDDLGPIGITSGYRCKGHPLYESNPDSQHIVGKAADTVYLDSTVREAFYRSIQIRQFAYGGIIIYEWGLHLDTRGYKYRAAYWDGIKIAVAEALKLHKEKDIS